MSLHIERLGHGPCPLVLLHGWATHGAMLSPLSEALRETCTLYVVDLPGHGRSRHSALLLELTMVANAIAKATPPALWMGWSLGGQIALTAALEHPERVQALIMLCSTPCFARTDDWPHGAQPWLLQQMAENLQNDFEGTLEAFLALETIGSEHPRAELQRLREQMFAHGTPALPMLQQGIRVLGETDLRGRLASLNCPSLWLAGRRDRLVPPAGMRWAAEAAQGEFRMLAGAGHAPFIGHTEAIVEAMAPLLATQP